MAGFETAPIVEGGIPIAPRTQPSAYPTASPGIGRVLPVKEKKEEPEFKAPETKGMWPASISAYMEENERIARKAQTDPNYRGGEEYRNDLGKLAEYYENSTMFTKRMQSKEGKFYEKKVPWENEEFLEQAYDPDFFRSQEGQGFGEAWVQPWSGYKQFQKTPERISFADEMGDFMQKGLDDIQAKGVTEITMPDGRTRKITINDTPEDKVKWLFDSKYTSPGMAEEAEKLFDDLSPARKERFNNDPKEWAYDKFAKEYAQVEKEYDIQGTRTGGRYVSGGGRSSNELYSFVHQAQTGTPTNWEAEYPQLSKEQLESLQLKERFGDKKWERIRIQRTGTEGENKPIALTVNEAGKKELLTVLEWQRKEGEEWKVLVGYQKEVKAEDGTVTYEPAVKTIPAKHASADIESLTAHKGQSGMTIERFMRENPEIFGEQQKAAEKVKQKETKASGRYDSEGLKKYTSPKKGGAIGYINTADGKKDLTKSQFDAVEKAIAEDGEISIESIDWILKQ